MKSLEALNNDISRTDSIISRLMYRMDSQLADVLRSSPSPNLIYGSEQCFKSRILSARVESMKLHRAKLEGLIAQAQGVNVKGAHIRRALVRRKLRRAGRVDIINNINSYTLSDLEAQFG